MRFSELREINPEDVRFKPYEKAIGYDHETKEWRCDLFSHFSRFENIREDERECYDYLPYVCVGGCYDRILPYEGNENLIPESSGYKPYDYVLGTFNNDTKIDIFSHIGNNGRIVCLNKAYMPRRVRPFDAKCFRDRENARGLKAGQKVLVRLDDDKASFWKADIYGCFSYRMMLHQCVGSYYFYVIPYEGNERLLGTNESHIRKI